MAHRSTPPRSRRALAALATLAATVLATALAGPAQADPRQVLEEPLESRVACEGSTTDGQVLDFNVVADATGEVTWSYLEVIEEGWGEDIAEGRPLTATLADGTVEAVFDLEDATTGASLGTATLAGRYTEGETTTESTRWRDATVQWHRVTTVTPYDVTWTTLDIPGWEVATFECFAEASEATTTWTAPHRVVSSGGQWSLSADCTTDDILWLDVVTHDAGTNLLVDTAGGWADVSVTGPAGGAQTGTVDWYDWDGNLISSGQASVVWTRTGTKVTQASPDRTSNRVEHVTGYRLSFDIAGLDGGRLTHACDADLTEWRQAGELGE